MAQTIALAVGTTAATSADIVLTDGQTRTVGIFGASALPDRISLNLMIDTPGEDQFVARLVGGQPPIVITGAGTYRVPRPANMDVAVGVFTEG